MTLIQPAVWGHFEGCSYIAVFVFPDHRWIKERRDEWQPTDFSVKAQVWQETSLDLEPPKYTLYTHMYRARALQSR